ncbi:MAG: type II toxin-antitoxin system RelE/ParE family toxin [Solirubrobacteraceae bacterium]
MVKTSEFAQWSQTLAPERQAKVASAVARIVERGPSLGRPHVDSIKGSRLHKLKEARIDRGTRVLFAFDSNRNAVMLLGGDKSGKWNRWYPSKVHQAERLYLDHERSIGKGAGWLNQHAAGRTRAHLSR